MWLRLSPHWEDCSFFKDWEFQFEGVGLHLSLEGIASAYFFRHGPNGQGFQPVGVLECIETMLSLHVVQAIAKVVAFEDTHELIALRAKLADEVLIAFVE